MSKRTTAFPSFFLILLALSLPVAQLLAQTELNRAKKKGKETRIIEVEVKRNAILNTTNKKREAGDEAKALSARVELEFVTLSHDKSLLVGYYQDGWFEMISLHDAKNKKQLGSVYCDGGVPTVFRFSKDNRFLGAKTGVGWYVWKIPSFEKVFVLGDVDLDRLIEANQDGVDQPATDAESKAGGNEKSKPESEAPPQ